jgi:hypothetical protein
MSQLTCPEGAYVTRVYGRAGSSIDKFCALCSDGTNHCNGTGNGGGDFGLNNRLGFNKISNYSYGNDDMSGFAINNPDGLSVTKYGTTSGITQSDYKCPLNQVINNISYVGDTNTGWAHHVQGVGCISIPTPKYKLTCPANSYITELRGGAGAAVDRLCAKCSDGTNLGCLGVSGGGIPFNQTSNDGFEKFDISEITDNNDKILRNITLYGKNITSPRYGDTGGTSSTLKCNDGEVISSITPISNWGNSTLTPSLSSVLCYKKPVATTGTGTGSNTGSGSSSGSNTGTGSGSGSNTGTGSGTGSNTGTNTGTGSGSGSNTGTGSGTGTNTGSGSGSGTNTGSGSGSSTNTETENTNYTTGDNTEDDTPNYTLYIILFIVVVIVMSLLFMGDGESKNKRRMMYNQYPQNNMYNQYPMQNMPMNNMQMSNMPMQNMSMSQY